MERSLAVSRFQNIEVKKEILESCEFDVEKNRDLIKHVKQELYEYDEPISCGVAIELEKKVDSIKKDNELTFVKTQKMTFKTYNDDAHFFQTEYNNNTLHKKPEKVVTLKVRLNKNWLDFCKICKKTFLSKTLFQRHQTNRQCKRKPYHCHLCERSYSEKNILSMHQFVVHGHNHIVTNYCYSKYNIQTMIKLQNRNLKDLTLETKLLNLQNNLQNCVVCNRVFSSKQDLNNHKNHSLIHKVNDLVQSLK